MTSSTSLPRSDRFRSATLHPALYGLSLLALAVFFSGEAGLGLIATPSNAGPYEITWQGLVGVVSFSFLLHLALYGLLSTAIDQSFVRLDQEGITYRDVFLQPQTIPWNRIDRIQGPTGWSTLAVNYRDARDRARSVDLTLLIGPIYEGTIAAAVRRYRPELLAG